MTTTTPSLIRNPVPARARRRGFTLVELMVAATLSAFVLVGVMSSFLFMGRSGANLRNYSDMESQSRKALEQFAEDVRQASAIAWSTNVSVTLTVNSAAVAYYYDSATTTFYRQTATGTTALITGVTAGTFVYKPYNVAGALLPLATPANLTAAGVSTKQLQISLEASRTTQTVSSATNLVLSARYILRNKIVTA
jgi:prepilin-type N-terminal cleavage/methylation domain-containing protein